MAANVRNKQQQSKENETVNYKYIIILSARLSIELLPKEIDRKSTSSAYIMTLSQNFCPSAAQAAVTRGNSQAQNRSDGAQKKSVGFAPELGPKFKFASYASAVHILTVQISSGHLCVYSCPL